MSEAAPDWTITDIEADEVRRPDDVVVIDRGRLVTTGTVEALTEGSARVRTPEPERLAARLAADGGRVERSGADAHVVTGLDLDRIGDAAPSC